MGIVDLGLILNSLRAVSDERLMYGVKQLGLQIPDTKLSLAFSAYGLTNYLSGVPQNQLRASIHGIPEHEVEAIRWRGVFIFRAYTTFLYMRSEHLESGLDSIPADSPLKPFRDFFRSGCSKRDEDTMAQHIRNSLAHGTFDLSPDFQVATFTDRQWRARISARDFVDGLCNEVFRFYGATLHAAR